MLFDEDYIIPRRQRPPVNRENVLGLLPPDAPEPRPVEKYYSIYSPELPLRTKKHGTMGPAHIVVNPKKYVKQQDRSLPQPIKFEYPDQLPRKEPVVTKDIVPIHGLQTNKNFVRTNALSVIAQPAKKPEHKEVKYINKPDYGCVPRYLDNVKVEVNADNGIKRQLAASRAYHEDPSHQRMTEEERVMLLNGLKNRWQKINTDYSKTSFTLDVGSMREKKEAQERELAAVENDMEKLSRRYVFVGEY